MQVDEEQGHGLGRGRPRRSAQAFHHRAPRQRVLQAVALDRALQALLYFSQFMHVERHGVNAGNAAVVTEVGNTMARVPRASPWMSRRSSLTVRPSKAVAKLVLTAAQAPSP